MSFWPGVAPRSTIAAVGRPPDQMKASILLSLIAPTDSATLSFSRLTSFSGSMPYASRSRSAMSSVPLPGAPVEILFPFRSLIFSIPLPWTVTTWVLLS